MHGATHSFQPVQYYIYLVLICKLMRISKHLKTASVLTYHLIKALSIVII